MPQVNWMLMLSAIGLVIGVIGAAAGWLIARWAVAVMLALALARFLRFLLAPLGFFLLQLRSARSRAV